MMQIQNSMSLMTSMQQGPKSLSETQKQNLSEVLSNYDAKDMSDSDAKALVQEIADIGIEKGLGLTTALQDAGINAGELAQQAGIGGPPGGKGPGPSGGPPPGGGKGGPGGPSGAEAAGGTDSAAVQTLQSVVEQLQEAATDSDSDEDFSTLLLQTLEDAGLDTSNPIVDIRV